MCLTRCSCPPLVSSQGSFQCLHPDSKQKTRCTSCLPCHFYNLIAQLCHRNTEALVEGQPFPSFLLCPHWFLRPNSAFPSATKSSLDALRRRLHDSNLQQLFFSSSSHSCPSAPPLLRASILLAIPHILFRPSLEDIQVLVLLNYFILWFLLLLN